MNLNSSRTTRFRSVGAGVLLAALVGAFGASAASSTKAIQAAISDPGRPQADIQRDANRKPLEVLKFSGIKPGDKVAEFLPGQAFYYTRLLSKLVGPKGHVYVIVRLASRPNPLKDDPRYENVSVVSWKETLELPEPVDVIWTSDNYHDFVNNPAMSPPGTVPKVFANLKPGGIFLVLDHRAAAGTGISDTGRLHRIDPEVVKGDALAAGFVLEADSDVLKRPNDDHTLSARDPSMHDVTDQFIFKFRKPAGAKPSSAAN